MNSKNQPLNNQPNENALGVTGHDYDNDFALSGSMGGGIMQSDTMLGPQGADGSAPGSNTPASLPANSTQYGDDRDSMAGDKADSGGRHDNPYDAAQPSRAAAENEDPADLASLSGHSDQSQPSETGEALAGLNDQAARDKGLEGKSHLYTPGETDEDYPAT